MLYLRNASSIKLYRGRETTLTAESHQPCGQIVSYFNKAVGIKLEESYLLLEILIAITFKLSRTNVAHKQYVGQRRVWWA